MKADQSLIVVFSNKLKSTLLSDMLSMLDIMKFQSSQAHGAAR